MYVDGREKGMLVRIKICSFRIEFPLSGEGGRTGRTREIFLIQVTSAEIILSHFEGIYDNILVPDGSVDLDC